MGTRNRLCILVPPFRSSAKYDRNRPELREWTPMRRGWHFLAIFGSHLWGLVLLYNWHPGLRNNFGGNCCYLSAN